MIQSFFVWLLGPELAFVSFIVGGVLFVFGLVGIANNASEILEWWEKKKTK